MKKTTWTITIALGLIFSILSSTAQTLDKDYQDGKVIFQIKEGIAMMMPADDKGVVNMETTPFLFSLAKKYNITKVFQKHPHISDDALRNTYEIEFKNYSGVENLVRELGSLSFIRYAVKKSLPHLFYAPNDTYYNSTNMWHLYQINAEGAWDINKGSASVIVADVDGAFLTTHPDLSAKLVSGYDVSDHDYNVNPPTSSAGWDHGSHTIGIAGASTDNSTGVASIGFNVSLMPIKATADGSSNSEAIDAGYDGIVYAADNGASVISLSWGGTQTSDTAYVQQVVDYAYSKGCVIVAAAGNSSVQTKNYPAACRHVIAVASTGTGDVLSYFSNFGSWITVCAPGENILSTITAHNGSSGTYEYDFLSGTSMACPMVAGLCGLMRSVNSSLTSDQITACLKSSCDNINSMNSGYVGKMGGGRINAKAALECVSAISTPPLANFQANLTVISAGSSVNFTDLSTNSPTSWSWTFTGGTPSTSTAQNPTGITYNTAGCYAVTLVATNASGSNTATKTCYINVGAGVTYFCDSLTNLNFAKDTLTIYTFPKSSGTWGYVTGTNSYGTQGIAEYFSSPPPATYQVSGLGVYFAKAYAGNSSHTVSLKLWDNVGGKPTNVLATQNVNITSLLTNQITFINFASPVTVTGSYFAGVTFTGTGASLDTVVVVTSKVNEVKPNTGWMLLSLNNWLSDSAALNGGPSIANAIFPVVCKASLTGVNDHVSSSGMEIYPNPTTGEINIQLAQGSDEKINLSVYNAMGQVIRKAGITDVHNGLITLNLSDEGSGVYYIESRTSEGSTFRKVILTK